MIRRHAVDDVISCQQELGSGDGVVCIVIQNVSVDELPHQDWQQALFGSRLDVCRKTMLAAGLS